MIPTNKMLLNYTLAAAAGAFVGYKVSTKHRGQGAVFGAAVVAMLYGVTKERVLAA